MGKKEQEITRRKARGRELYLLLRMDTKDITERLLAEGVMRSRSFESAYRLVRADLQEVRDALTAEQVVALGDPIERARYIAHMQFVMEHAAREMAKSENVSTTQTKLPKEGGTVVSVKKTDRGGVNQRWAQTYMEAVKSIALVTGGAAKPVMPFDEDLDDGKPKETPPPFEFVTSGKPLDELIELNADGMGKVN